MRDVAAKERVLVGFRERNGRFVADMNECHILRSEIADSLAVITKLMESLECRGSIPQIEVACGDQQCALIIRHLEELSEADTDRMRSFTRESGIGIFLQSAGPDSIVLLAPEDLQLEFAIESLGLRFQFEPLDFAQVNGDLNQKMVMRAMELLDPQAEDHILDLFCGLGNFTLPLATRAGQVVGVEGAVNSVADQSFEYAGEGAGLAGDQRRITELLHELQRAWTARTAQAEKSTVVQQDLGEAVAAHRDGLRELSVASEALRDQCAELTALLTTYRT